MPKIAYLILPLLLVGAGCVSQTSTSIDVTAGGNNGIESTLKTNTEAAVDADGPADVSAGAEAQVDLDLDADIPVDVSLTMVSMTSTGFSPATLTVKAGSTVTFQNDDTANHWIASNPHPTHTALPGFDAKKVIAPGASYSYTFTQTGTWSYHDHLNSEMTGTIVVE